MFKSSLTILFSLSILLFSVSATASSGVWGAMAFAKSPSENRFGFVVNQESKESAKQAALAKCGADCSTDGNETAFQKYCGAAVIGSRSSSYQKYYGFDQSNVTKAEDEAMMSCSYNKALNKWSDMKCEVVASGCSGL